MKVKRFFAQTMAEALKQVSEQMGPDAVILSNRRVDGGAEIVYHEPGGGGAVFSVGSITYPCSVIVDDTISRITTNVLKRFLD